MTTAQQTEVRPGRISWRSVAVPAAVLLLPGLAYLGTVLLPFLASDLDALPPDELASGRRTRRPRG